MSTLGERDQNKDQELELTICQERYKSLTEMHREKVAEAEKLNQRVRELEETVLVGDDAARSVRDYQQKFQAMNEENKTLAKMHMEKVAEVEKLSQTNRELEKAVLASGAAENTLRDYKRKFQEMNEELITLHQQLPNEKVTANRVATVVANLWKDGKDKMMPVKQWLEERRFLQGEMQILRDRLAMTDRAVKSEAQLKEKLQLKIQVLEETRRETSSNSTTNTPEASSKKASAAQVSHSLHSNSTSDAQENSEEKPQSENPTAETERSVPFVLYNLKRNEVSYLTKASHEKDQILKDKNDTIEMLAKKMETLTMTNEVEAKNMRRKVAAKEKEVAALMRKEKDQKVAEMRVLKDRDDAIEMLRKKVETLTKENEVEANNMRREVDAKEKEVTALMRKEKDQKVAEIMSVLKEKDDTIEMLRKKVETLTKENQVEAKNMRREVDAKEKEFAALMRKEKDEKADVMRLLKYKDNAIERLTKEVETLTEKNEVDAKKMKRELASMGLEVIKMRMEKDQKVAEVEKLTRALYRPGTIINNNNNQYGDSDSDGDGDDVDNDDGPGMNVNQYGRGMNIYPYGPGMNVSQYGQGINIYPYGPGIIIIIINMGEE